MSDLMNAVYEIREHHDAYALAESYYHGEVAEVFASAAVRRALRGAKGGFDVNLARRPVDAVLDRMKILAVTVPEDESATRQLVDTVWVPNRLDRYSKTIHWGALVHGDSYVIAWPGELDGTVELFYNSPLTTRVFYSPENPRVKAYAAKLWCSVGGQNAVHRVDLYYPDRIERYISAAGSGGRQESDWQPYADDDQEPVLANPYGVVPVFHFRTGEPYGRPEHQGAFGPQNAVTKLSQTLMSTVDFQAFPQRYALMTAMDAESLLDDDPDDPTAAPGSGTTEPLEAGPGTVWRMPDASKVGQFDPANMDAFLQPLGFYIRAMAAATATPLRFFDPQGQVPSGEALRADEAPLASRIRDTEDILTEEWQELLVFSSAVTGAPIAPPDIKWAPVQTVDDLAGWQTVAAKQAAGVPARQALVEAGYTSDLVEEWLDGSEKPNLDTRLAALTQIGAALQQLGAAVQMGAVDQTTVNTILGQVLGELVQEPEDPAA